MKLNQNLLILSVCDRIHWCSFRLLMRQPYRLFIWSNFCFPSIGHEVASVSAYVYKIYSMLICAYFIHLNSFPLVCGQSCYLFHATSAKTFPNVSMKLFGGRGVEVHSWKWYNDRPTTFWIYIPSVRPQIQYTQWEEHSFLVGLEIVL